MTHGVPRNHIWTLAVGLSEGGYSIQADNCPCSKPSHPSSRFPPSFVGNNYCESGNPTNMYGGQFYGDDLLWNGQQCEGQCCSDGNLPQGSLSNFQILQVMILKYIFAMTKEASMTLLYDWRRCMFNK